ncbi:MAG TPA: MMPL family transporter [Solirubrobacteraceae bacterium]|nr:MMPL family transporter [Solirubrobacteraceae bacterium]
MHSTAHFRPRRLPRLAGRIARGGSGRPLPWASRRHHTRPRLRTRGALSVSRRRALGALGVWALAVVGLGLLGQRVEGRLSPLTLEVPGSPSAKAEALLQHRFGNSIPIAILLRGSPQALASQGPAVVRSLRTLSNVEVLSPFEGSQTFASASKSELRPTPDAALVLVSFIRRQSEAMATVPATESILKRTVRAPVHSYLTGLAVVGKALQDATLSSTEQAELIALPVLILVLLLVFRSPVAAALPLLMGGATVVAGHGLLWLASFITPINSLGVAIAAMMSLALGVDYSLLMISRVRQELAAGASHPAAIATARRLAGRTIAAAGGTLALTMLAASAVATPGLLGPVAIGVVISGLLSVALALTALPAMLRLLGPLLNRWELRLPRRGQGRSLPGAAALAQRLLSHPALVAPAILLGMLALAVPAGALQMGPPDPSELPAGSPVRTAVRVVERTIGPGWTAPFVIIANAHSGPMTTSQRIDALARWQAEVARAPDVAAVLGPASVAGAQQRLAEAHVQLAAAPRQLTAADRGVAGLRSGLQSARSGVQALRSGLAAALGGAKALGSGLQSAHGAAGELASAGGRAHSGAQALAAGAGVAQQGASRLAAESARARAGAGELASASARAHAGASRLAAESARARAGATQIAAAAEGAQQGASSLAAESGHARAGAGELAEGLAQAADASAQLAHGLGEAEAGAKALAASDHRLATGAAEEATGMEELDATVRAVAAPLQLLSEELHAWAGLIEASRSSEAAIEAKLEEAMRQLEAMTLGREDPRYPALAQALSSLKGMLEGSGLARLEGGRRQLQSALERLLALPEELSKLLTDFNRLTVGARRIATGAQESEEGAQRLSSAIDALHHGSGQLAGGMQSLQAGAGRLEGGLALLEAGSGQLAGGLGQLSAANRGLAGGLNALAGGNQALAGGLGRVATGSDRLAGGLGTLAAGNRQLAGGLGAAVAGSGRLAGGLEALAAGNRQLAGGLGAAVAGSGRLAGGLASAHQRTGALQAGLAAAQRPLAHYAAMLERYEHDFRLLHAKAPGTLDSGYLVLAALDGTVGAAREQAAQLVNVNGGGQAARMMIIAASPPNSAATAALSARLRASLPALARATGATVQVGQGAQYLLDYKNANTARFPWLVLSLAAIAALMLIVILRALPLALIAVALNLATIAVALGALELLTATHLLGGPGYIDAASGAGIVSIMFVLSIDYEVFLLMRMREHWLARRDANAAIFHGLGNTAGVITGSAAIMTAVFCAFASASVVPLRQFGIGLTIAVLLDATLVRLVLLPALMRLAGARIWWLPRALERRLPAIEGTASA